MVETSLEAVALCGASLLSDAFAPVPSPSELGFLNSSRVSMALFRRLPVLVGLSFCVTCGVTFLARRLATLPIFRLVRSRSLSLGAWVPKNLARRRKPSAARCLLDLLGPPGRRSGCWPHDGEVAGGAVADSTLVISGSGRWPRRSQVRGQLRHDPIATAG